MSVGVRIALVAGQTAGGIARHVGSLVPELVNRGARVEVHGPAAMRSLGPGTAGAAFFHVEVPGGGSPAATGKALLRLARRLRGADLVHAHGIRAGLVGGLAARLAGVGHVVVTVHNAVEGREGAAGAAERLLAVLAERRLYVSEDIAERGRSAVPARAGSVIVMPVGADVRPSSRPPGRQVVSEVEGEAGLLLVDQVERAGEPSPADASAAATGSGTDARAPLGMLGMTEGTLLVLAVGRLARQKGFDVLVDAAGLLDAKLPGGPASPAVPAVPGVLIAIVGEGPERGDLEERIRERGVSGRVVLLGFRADLRALTEAADVVCMPSRWEGSPLALHEAMAAGRPVVAAAVGGIPALAGDAAVLVPPEDPQALAIALRRVLDDAGLRARLGEASRAAAAAWPDAAATARRVADLYEEVLGRPLSGVSRRRRGRTPSQPRDAGQSTPGRP